MFYLHPFSTIKFVNGNEETPVVALITIDPPEEVISDNLSTIYGEMVNYFQATINWGDGTPLQTGNVVISDGSVGVINDPRIAWGTPGLDNLKGGIVNVDDPTTQLLHGQPTAFNVFGFHTYSNPYIKSYNITVTVSYPGEPTQSIVSIAEVIVYGGSNPGPMSDGVILAPIQPDSWGAHGPNQTIEENYLKQERNNAVFREHTFSGMNRRGGSVRWPPNPMQI